MTFWKNLFKTQDMIEQEFRDAETEQILQKAKENKLKQEQAEAKKKAAAEKRKATLEAKKKAEAEAKKKAAAEAKKKKSPKEIATAKGEPYISVVAVEVDKNNLGNGNFELDWNDKFIKDLRAAGYPGKTDEDVVDMWFRNICRNVLAETFEQEEAQKPPVDNVRYINRKAGDNGRTEVS